MPVKTPLLNPEEAKAAAAIINDGLLHTLATPDMAFLNQHHWYVPVMLYGAEKKSFKEHRSVMGGRDPIGRGLTVDTHYVMKLYRDEPLVFTEPQHPNAGKVFGEVFLVTPSELAELDSRYMNGSFGRRYSRLVRWWKLEEDPKKEKTVYINRVLFFTAWAPAWDTRAEDNNVARREKP
jgi:gamma-glutamylcyclotransferase (GGCT)/AIG2-like uncharacterized protein YtfP